MKRKTLLKGTTVDTRINTTERIFEVLTYENEYVLVNLVDAYLLVSRQEAKGVKQYYINGGFRPIAKDRIIELYRKEVSEEVERELSDNWDSTFLTGQD